VLTWSISVERLPLDQITTLPFPWDAEQAISPLELMQA